MLPIKHTKEEMDSTITGTLKMDRKTKMLCKRLKPGDIALIAHRNLDELAAQDLVEKGIKAVINADDTFSGEYPALGTSYLLQRGIFILDHVGDGIFSRVREGALVSIVGNSVYCNGEIIGQGRIIDQKLLAKKYALAEKNLKHQLDLFVQNTLEYARREKNLILGNLEIPEIKTRLSGKHVLIVVRGKIINVIYGPYVRTLRSKACVNWCRRWRRCNL